MARTSRLQGGLNLTILIAAAVVIAFAVNFILSGTRLRLDLSDHKVNVLSPASRVAVHALDGLEVRLFIAPDLPETIPFGPAGQELRIQGFAQKLRDTLAEYQAYGSDMSVFEVHDDLLKEAERLKVKSFTGAGGSVTKEGALELKRYVLGATFHYKNVTEVFDLALDPGTYEFEITKRLLRLKEKADSALTMREVLAAGAALADATAACTHALEIPQDSNSSAPLAGMLAPEANQASLSAAAPQITAACAAITPPLDRAKALAPKSRQLERMTLIAQALADESAAFAHELKSPTAPDAAPGAAPNAPPPSTAATHQRLLAIGRAMVQEKADLDDSPGRRQIGFVCNAVTFCPFPDETPLFPAEIGSLAQKNQMMQSVLPMLTRIQQEMNLVLQQIQQGLFKARGFDIVKVDLDHPIPSDVAALVVFGAQATFGDHQLYAIDQFVMRGGSLLAFLSPFDVKMQLMNTQGELDESGAISRTPSNLQTLLDAYGIHPTGALVTDPQHAAEIVLYANVNALGRTFVQQAAFPDALLPTLTDFDRDNPLVRATTALTLPYATALDVQAPAGATATVLARSASSTILVDDLTLPIYPPQALDAALASRAPTGSVPLVALMTGTLPSAFRGKPTPERPEPPNKSNDPVPEAQRLDSGAGRVLVVASNLGLLPLSTSTVFDGFNLAMLTGQDGGLEHLDDFRRYQVNYQNWSLRVGQVQHTLQGNLQFLHNTLDWAVQREALAELRSKVDAPRPLRTTTASERTLLQAAALVVPALLTSLACLGWLLRRRVRARRLTLG